MPSNKVTALLIIVLGTALAWRWMYPYPEPVAKRLLPPILQPIEEQARRDYLADMLEHNVWRISGGQTGDGSDLSPDGNKSSTADDQQSNKSDAGSKSWRLLGVSQYSIKPVVIIDDGLGVRTYQLGDELPDGSKISKIMPFGIQVLKSGENEKIYLFGKK